MTPLFSDQEMQARVSRLREEMDRAGVGAALVTSIHNIIYLTDFWFGQPYGRNAMAVIPLRSDPVLVTPAMEAGRARDFTWVKEIRTYTDVEAPVQAVARLAAEILGDRGLAGAKIGVEEDVIPVQQWRAIQHKLPKASLVDITDIFERCRLVKSAEEIELTRKLARLCEVAFQGLDDALAIGETEIELAAAGEAAMRRAFARVFPDIEYIRGRISFRAGPRLWGHHDPIARLVHKGDLIFMSAHPIVMGYFSTMARQRIAGPIPEAMKRPFQVCIQAADRCLEAIKPGVKFSDIDRVALQVFEEAGLAQYKGFGTGHSHGLMGPFWGRDKLGEYRPYNHIPLQPGVITSMEPSLSIPGIGTFMNNDMVLVTEQGAELLTHYPRELRSIA